MTLARSLEISVQLNSVQLVSADTATAERSAINSRLFIFAYVIYYKYQIISRLRIDSSIWGTVGDWWVCQAGSSCGRWLVTYNSSLMERKKSTLEDYPVVKKLGKGAFGQVFLVKNNKGEFALKKITKQQLIKSRKLYQPYIEKQVLSRLNHPGVIKMFDTFSDNEHIYLVLQFCEMGDFTRLLKACKLPEPTMRHYIAELVVMLEYLKDNQVVHRDFKTSNLLGTKDGHLKLTDFGCAYAPVAFLGQQTYDKIVNIKKMSEEQNVEEDGERRATFVGTPYYMSPEILKDSVCDYQADLWALGCVIYEMYVGQPPFTDADQYTVFKKIQEAQLEFPAGVKIPEEVKDLISRLLNKDKSKRLGCAKDPTDGNSFDLGLKGHKFFEAINWKNLFNQPVPNINDLMGLIKEQDQIKMKKLSSSRYLISGIVEKKMFLGNYKERQMALLSDPKLIYFDETTGEKKGEIELDLNTPIELDGNKFTVVGKKKKYFFKAKKEEHLHSASQWVEKIKEAISKAFY